MNKKNFFRTLAVAAMATVAITSCDNSAPKMDDKTQAAEQSAPVELKIAFVEVDSIMTQYAFCKDYTEILQKKGQNIQNTLASKQRALQQAAGYRGSAGGPGRVHSAFGCHGICYRRTPAL